MSARTVRSRPSVGVDTYYKDRLYPRIVRAVSAILERKDSVAPVDVLVEMDLLKVEHLEDWRFGRVPYLERVIRCNLTRLGRLLRILRSHAHDLKLVPSHTPATECAGWSGSCVSLRPLGLCGAFLEG